MKTLFPYRSETSIWRILAQTIGLLFVAPVFMLFFFFIATLLERTP
jgi:hypothetical protein